MLTTAIWPSHEIAAGQGKEGFRVERWKNISEILDKCDIGVATMHKIITETTDVAKSGNSVDSMDFLDDIKANAW